MLVVGIRRSLEPQQASDAYDRYLMQPGLTPQDKAEAREELEELRRRRSIMTVASAPSRAPVYLDGKKTEPAGTTPFSVQVSPGKHKVEIDQKGYRPYSREVEAKFGQAIIVDAQLERDPNQPTGPYDKTRTLEPEFERPKRFTAEGELGVAFSKLGSFSQSPRFGASIAAVYWLANWDRTMLGIGLRLNGTSDSWGNSIGAPQTLPDCTRTIPNSETASEFSAFGVGALGYRPTSRLRFGADAGFGAAGYSTSVLGGDLFYPTCTPSTGLQFAAHVGTEASYAIVPMLRAVLVPLAMEIHPSYSGARVEATGAWLRLRLGLGLAVDL